MTEQSVPAANLSRMIAAIFESLGLGRTDATCVADSLVSADLDGVSSHWVALVPMYVQRVKAGGVSVCATPSIVDDLGGLIVMTAANTFGQVSCEAAVKLAIQRARQHGVSVVAVRDGFHFGAAAYWSRKFAQEGMIGFSFSNIREVGIEFELNGTMMQKAKVSDMAFPIDELIAELSLGLTLQAGDMLLTGTPSGIGSKEMNGNFEPR